MTHMASQALTPEENLLILSARLTLSDKNSAELQQILQKNLNWSWIKKNSQKLGVAPLLYKHLSQENYARFVPPDVNAFLTNEYRRQSIKNLRTYGRLHQILQSTNQANIPIILLKGVYLARWIYGDIACRPMMDIDLLVRAEDQRKVQKIMSDLGYSQNITHQSPQHEVIARQEAHLDRHLPVFFKNNENKVDAHLNIIPGTSLDPALMRQVWDRSITDELDGLPVRILSPGDQLLYLALHLHLHMKEARTAGNVTLYWFCDIYEFLRRGQDQMDWPQLIDVAHRHGVSDQLLSVLKLIHRHWSDDVTSAGGDSFDSIFSVLPSRIRDQGRNERDSEKHLVGKRSAFYGNDALSLKSIFQDEIPHVHHDTRVLENRWAHVGTVMKEEGRLKGLVFIFRQFFPAHTYILARYQPKNPFKTALCYLTHPFKVLIRTLKGFISKLNPSRPK